MQGIRALGILWTLSNAFKTSPLDLEVGHTTTKCGLLEWPSSLNMVVLSSLGQSKGSGAAAEPGL